MTAGTPVQNNCRQCRVSIGLELECSALDVLAGSGRTLLGNFELIGTARGLRPLCDGLETQHIVQRCGADLAGDRHRCLSCGHRRHPRHDQDNSASPGRNSDDGRALARHAIPARKGRRNVFRRPPRAYFWTVTAWLPAPNCAVTEVLDTLALATCEVRAELLLPA